LNYPSDTLNSSEPLEIYTFQQAYAILFYDSLCWVMPYKTKAEVCKTQDTICKNLICDSNHLTYGFQEVRVTLNVSLKGLRTMVWFSECPSYPGYDLSEVIWLDTVIKSKAKKSVQLSERDSTVLESSYTSAVVLELSS